MLKGLNVFFDSSLLLILDFFSELSRKFFSNRKKSFLCRNFWILGWRFLGVGCIIYSVWLVIENIVKNYFVFRRKNNDVFYV